MPNFSSDQLRSIARLYHDLSAAVGQFRLDRIHEGVPLDDPGIVQLLGLQFSLANTSSSFYLQAAQVTLADADRVAIQITEATKAAIDSVKTLQVINKVVTIGSAAGVVVLSAMTGDMNQIATAVEGVYTAINS